MLIGHSENGSRTGGGSEQNTAIIASARSAAAIATVYRDRADDDILCSATTIPSSADLSYHIESKMWKPGTSKPKEKAASQPKETSANGAAADGNTSSSSKKKLSGATMGMRFMQRKMEAEEARKQALEEKKVQEQMEWTTTEQDGEGGPAEDEPQTAASLPQTATPSDMYGVKSDLIGRRSFGGFCPHVSQSYKSACDAWEKGKRADNDRKEHISDEELLRRYKSYVTGNGDMDTTAPVPIGNLQEKVKKKGKRKYQSPHKGEKRKR